MKPRVLIVAAAIVISGSPLQARAAGGGANLHGIGAKATWRGEFENVTVPSPQACISGRCDEFALDVRLAPAERPRMAGLLVAVSRKPAVVDNLYNLDLFVYGPDGRLAAASTNGPYLPDEAALVRRPIDGRYRAVIVPTDVVGRATYRASAMFRSAPRGTPARDLLPNLVARRPTNIGIESGVSATPFVTFDRGLRGPGSCYALEAADGHSRCLRFDQSVANQGEGALELRYRDEPDGRMRQRIYRSDGSHRDRIAGNIEFHAAHAHFHYAGFMQSFLYAMGPDGSKGRLMRSAAKQGFCMVDVLDLRLGRRGSAPKSYDVPGACDGNAEDDRGRFTWAGISPGWADVYPWNFADQFIDIAGVPDGRYVLELRCNVDGFLQETTRSDNVSTAPIEIRGDVATTL